MILYHDNKHGRQYEPDGRLSNNWSPDGPFGEKEYVSVYFRLDTPSYYRNRAGVGFATEEDRAAFYAEAADTLRSLGWEVTTTDAKNGKAHLYLHPQSLSGTVLKRDVPRIAEAFSNGKLFKLGWVDLYSEVLDVSDEEYRELLEGKRSEARALLLKNGVTKRRDTFHTADSLVKYVAEKLQEPRIGITDDCGVQYDKEALGFARHVLGELVEQGYMVAASARGRDLVRTINKTEQKQRKLSIDAA